MKSAQNKPKRAEDLLAIYYDKNKSGTLDEGELLVFDVDRRSEELATHFGPNVGLQNITVYNPTKPIEHSGKKYLIGRVEPLEAIDSRIMFFEQEGQTWRLVSGAPVLGLEDPFFAEVHGWRIIGGVKAQRNDHGDFTFRTQFYRYREDPTELFGENGEIIPPFAKGPENMKDIRLIDLKNGKIAVFTRPTGAGAGLGKIGYIEVQKLEEIEAAIPMAQIIENQFYSDEWGGANDLHLLKNGQIGVLGHIAHFDGDVRHYYAMAFAFDPKRKKPSHLEILTTADEFPPVEPKASMHLGKVIFSGGLHRNPDGTADLYVGIGDVKSGKIQIKDPFLKYELTPQQG